jgi:hypothetical protein
MPHVSLKPSLENALLIADAAVEFFDAVYETFPNEVTCRRQIILETVHTLAGFLPRSTLTVDGWPDEVAAKLKSLHLLFGGLRDVLEATCRLLPALPHARHPLVIAALEPSGSCDYSEDDLSGHVADEVFAIFEPAVVPRSFGMHGGPLRDAIMKMARTAIGVPPDGVDGSTPPNPRDVWIYEQWVQHRKPLKQIRVELARNHHDWDQLNSDRAIHGAITRYAKRIGKSLEPRRQRKAMSPKQADSLKRLNDIQHHSTGLNGEAVESR